MSDVGIYEDLADELEALLAAPLTPLVPADPGDPLAVPPVPPTPEIPATYIAAKIDRAFSPATAVNIDGIPKPSVLICPGAATPTGQGTIGNRTVFADYVFVIAVVTEAAFTESGRKLAVVEAWRILERIRDRVQGVQSTAALKKRWRWGGESFVEAVEDDAHVVMAVRYTISGTVGND